MIDVALESLDLTQEHNSKLQSTFDHSFGINFPSKTKLQDKVKNLSIDLKTPKNQGIKVILSAIFH